MSIPCTHCKQAITFPPKAVVQLTQCDECGAVLCSACLKPGKNECPVCRFHEKQPIPPPQDGAE